MAITIDIDTARPYQVHVGTFLLEQAGPLVRATAGGARAVIVTDTNVGPLYQMPVKQSLESAGYEVSICTFEAGEAHKRAETYVAILEFVADPELFAELEKTPLTLELLNRDVARVALIIARNIDIKRAVVVADERETNQRKLLNFGHSAGHAVEACEHFELGHGNCVSIGMGVITRATALHGICDAALPGRIEELCARHGLKTRCDLDADAVFAEALHDKKRTGDTIDLVIPHGIGRCSIDRTPLSTFHELIAEGLGQKGDASAC